MFLGDGVFNASIAVELRRRGEVDGGVAVSRPPDSIVVPVYNEVRRLATSLDKIFPFVDARHPDYEVIVVHDRSTDDRLRYALAWDHRSAAPSWRCSPARCLASSGGGPAGGPFAPAPAGP